MKPAMQSPIDLLAQEKADFAARFVALCYHTQSEIIAMAERLEGASIDQLHIKDETMPSRNGIYPEGRKWYAEGGKTLASVAVNVTSRPLISPLEPTSTLIGGISVILHGEHPFVPSIHMNLRMFDDSEKGLLLSAVQDLNPMIPFADDTDAYHAGLKMLCAEYSAGAYSMLKETCDRYFFNPFIGEPRGVGGVFFEDMNSGDSAKDLALAERIARYFTSFYEQVVETRRQMSFTEADRKKQLERRALYALYNAMVDRGTVWGALNPAVNPSHMLASFPPYFLWQSDLRDVIARNTPDADVQAFVEELIAATECFTRQPINDIEKQKSFQRIVEAMRSYYQKHPDRKPAKEKVIPGWIARAQAEKFPEAKRTEILAALSAFPGYVRN